MKYIKLMLLLLTVLALAGGLTGERRPAGMRSRGKGGGCENTKIKARRGNA